MLKVMSTMPSTPTYHKVSRQRTELNTRIGLTRRHHVSLPAYGTEQLAGMAIIDFAAKPLNVDFDQVGEDVEVLVPDMLSNGGPAHHLIAVPRQIFKQRIFLAGELHIAAGTPHPARMGIKGQVSDADTFASQNRSAA